MKKTYLFCFSFLLLFAAKSLAQAPLAAANPNFEHEKILKLKQLSDKVVLPDSVYKILVDFASNRNVVAGSLTRMDFVYKIIYNQQLSKEDRLFACRYYLREYARLMIIFPYSS